MVTSSSASDGPLPLPSWSDDRTIGLLWTAGMATLPAGAAVGKATIVSTYCFCSSFRPLYAFLLIPTVCVGTTARVCWMWWLVFDGPMLPLTSNAAGFESSSGAGRATIASAYFFCSSFRPLYAFLLIPTVCVGKTSSPILARSCCCIFTCSSRLAFLCMEIQFGCMPMAYIFDPSSIFCCANGTP